MPIQTPFHPRTSEHNKSLDWKDWGGYFSANSYNVVNDFEYYAFRHSAGLVDITPLFKYKITGKDTSLFLSRLMVKDISKLKLDQATYCCWCDDRGMVIDDGTVMRFGENEYFVTAADPSYSWFLRFVKKLEVEIEDVTDSYCALAIQGPTSRDILKKMCDADMDNLKFFWTTSAKGDGFEFKISRTGYTGDLGYELWVKNEDALKLFDAVWGAGQNYNIRMSGIAALDMARIEAGLVMNGVDYHSSLHALIPDQMSTPYELGLGWTVNIEREPFIGQKALQAEKKNGSRWATVGIDINWPDLEELYNGHGLPPHTEAGAWRHSIPIYSDKQASNQIGYATSGTWSPILKKNIALATIEMDYAKSGTEVNFEVIVEHHRHTVRATVGKPQFFNPDRKRSIPTSKLEKAK
ncbi:MAG: aminomethyl transferase family protein [Cytophagales bacterium]|nr:aminomethyl transferase family protein [Cytophagales bacterium]